MGTSPHIPANTSTSSANGLLMSEECAHYERFATATYADDPFPMPKNKLLRYMKVRARCSTFCDYMTNLDKHPLHGPAWLNRMNNDPDVKNLMRMCLMLWPRQAKKCEQPLIGIGLVSESGIFDDAWTKLRKEKEKEQELLNQKVRIIEGPKAKGYMVTDELKRPATTTTVTTSSLPLQAKSRTASTISEQLKQLGNTASQPIDLDKSPTANLTTFYVEMNDNLIPQNDNVLRKHLRENPTLPNRELDLYRKARMTAFETVAKFKANSPVILQENVDDRNSSNNDDGVDSGIHHSYVIDEGKKKAKASFKHSKEKQKMLEQQRQAKRTIQQMNAFQPQYPQTITDDNNSKDDIPDDSFDGVDYTDGMDDDFAFDFNSDDIGNFNKDLYDDDTDPIYNNNTTKDKGKRKALSPYEMKQLVLDRNHFSKEPAFDGTNDTVVNNKEIENMYDDMEVVENKSPSSSAAPSYQVPEPSVVIAYRENHDNTQHIAIPKTLGANHLKDENARRLSMMRRKYEPKVLIKRRNISKEKKGYLETAKRSFAMKGLSPHEFHTLARRAKMPTTIQSRFYSSDSTNYSPTPSSSSSTTSSSSIISDISNRKDTKPTSTANSSKISPKRHIKFFKRPRGRPRKIPIPQAIVRIKLGRTRK
ncbi:hypothetical protein BDF20DRAFT_550757 [Mycotypha africana]|uniref:uncharacterized protein n=1 Tax=Mycotypha africana TaxID=64632 RepID=UPI002301D79F|nr:uncharacterized protein BDF20DRAFT_550757 [Mycotypha africana]KAI8977196.1 hypothetical protein BDF20DRAFT_550757 [Mycotypha africana]